MERYRIPENARVDLSRFDPRDLSGFDGDKDAGKARFKKLNRRLEELQEAFYAEGKHKLLIVLQAIDCGGKDGTIRSVFEHVNPQGVRVSSFKKPSELELAHDYLWRVHQHTPPTGHWTIFNRSHYEDVLVVRVHGFVPEERWRRRYDHIRDFERLLTDEGTTIVKIFLHISKDEQKERLQERIDIPRKRWKFSSKDLDERKLWDDYMAAFTEMLERTSTAAAPWYVVPADRNWYRDLVVAQIVVDTLEGLDIQLPEPEEGIEGLRIE